MTTRWEGGAAAIVGIALLFAGAGAILIGRTGVATVVLLVVATPLTYAGLCLPMPMIKAAGARLTFKSPKERANQSSAVDESAPDP
jgi:hypothetical protein